MTNSKKQKISKEISQTEEVLRISIESYQENMRSWKEDGNPDWEAYIELDKRHITELRTHITELKQLLTA